MSTHDTEAPGALKLAGQIQAAQDVRSGLSGELPLSGEASLDEPRQFVDEWVRVQTRLM